MRIIMGIQRRGKNINWSRKDYVVSNITKNNLSLSSKNGIKVKVFDDNNNIVNIFPTIASAAKYYDLSSCTLSKYIKLGYSIDNLRFKVKLRMLEFGSTIKNGVLLVFFQLQIKLLNFVLYIRQYYIVI